MGELKERIHVQVRRDLELIESALFKNLDPYLELVSQTARHILFSGGKRLRPLLMLLSARLCGYTRRDSIDFSTIFEYLHAATLLHDDLVDGAVMRRGASAAHSIWGNSTAVLVGDFLLARALSIASRSKRTEIIEVIAGVTENMSQGEIHQLMRKGAIDLNESEYLQIISNKTAVLIQGACRVGAILAGASQSSEKALAEYGINLGIAFQMADDLFDYTAEASVLGKETGADLKEGKLTLPVIHALSAATPSDRMLIERMIKEKDFSREEFDRLVDLLDGYGSFGYTERSASEKAEHAKTALSCFEPSETRDLLSDIAEYAVRRES